MCAILPFSTTVLQPKRASVTWQVPVTAAPGAKPITPPRTDANLIKRQTLFGNPDRSGVQLSPDGTQISYLAPKDGVMNVWVAPVDA